MTSATTSVPTHREPEPMGQTVVIGRSAGIGLETARRASTEPGVSCSSDQPRRTKMEFLVEFETHVPDRTPNSVVKYRRSEEAVASAKLGQQGDLVRPWRPNGASGKAVALYRADSAPQLDGLLGAPPMHDWTGVTVTSLEPHPNDPGAPG